MASPATHVPESWTRTTLGALGEYVNGRAFKPSEWGPKGRPIIRIQNLTGGRCATHFYDGDVDPRYLVRQGDLLISWSATLGAFLWNGPEAVLNQHIFKVSSRIDKRFHFYLAQSVINDLYRKAHGSGMVHVTRGPFLSTPVNIPPLEEQHRIVNAIESNFAMLDDASANLTNVERVLTAFWNSLLRSAFAGGLGDHHSSEGQNTSSFLRDELPEGWAWTTIGELKEFSLYGPRFSSEEYRSTGTAIIRTTDMGEDASIDFSDCPRVELSRKDLERYRVRRGDLLITRTGSLGTLAVFDSNLDAIAGAFLIQYRLRVPTETVRYISHWLKSPTGRTQLISRATGSGRPNLSSPAIDSIRVPLAPPEEQVTILRELEKNYSWVCATRETVRYVRAKIDKLRVAILQRALSGGLCASAQVVVSPSHTAESSAVEPVGPNTTQRRDRHQRRTPSAVA